MGGPDASHSIPGEPEVVPVGRDDDVLAPIRAKARDRPAQQPAARATPSSAAKLQADTSSRMRENPPTDINGTSYS